ncbi:hypothetical protein F4678DRAFT_430226 [Xylaria arbuscula]|nr:hypothetical protein F4678DRAFT_430226 [Xylaria arbuscula]
MELMYGLHEVQAPNSRESKDVVIDLIAVHGLGGHALRTWTDEKSGTCWIRDLLHDNVPNIRVMVFGYNAKRTNHSADLDFQDVATQLLAGMKRLRGDCEQRPVVFLAHSLGGLIVKKAITLSLSHNMDIDTYTKGVVFFATPHLGSKIANLAVFFENFSRLVLDTPSNFFRDLSTNATELESLNSLFSEFLATSKIPCLTFYEGFKTRRLWKSAIIVTRDSAVLGVENEDAICLNADHSSIVRFRSTDDNFKIVVHKLRSMVQKISSHEQRRESHQCLELHIPFSPGKYFLGRSTELEKLRGWFLGDPQRPIYAIALFGQSGVGKTQLALKYATDNQGSYDYIFFLNASSNLVLRNQFIKILPALNLSAVGVDAISDVITWLFNSKRRWLLVLDNANDLEDVMPTVTRLATLPGHVLLTTQDTRVKHNEFFSQCFQVELFSHEESKQLLFSRAGIVYPRLEDAQIAQSLVDELGCLPLAIDSAGAYISAREKSVKEYSDLFHNYQRDVLNHRPQATSYERSVFGSLELNFQRIDLLPGASTLLALLVFLDRTEITEEFLRRGAAKQHQWAPHGELIHVVPRYISQSLIDIINNDISFDQAVEELASFSIISYQKRTAAGRSFAIHPLYHNCAKLRMSEEQRRKSSAEALLFLAHAFPQSKQNSGEAEANLARSYVHHLHHSYDSFQDHSNNLTTDYLDSLAAPEDTSTTPRELIVQLILSATSTYTYGEGDKYRTGKLLEWSDELIKKSEDICLQAMALEVRLFHLHETGDYRGCIEPARAFLASTKVSIRQNPSILSESTNAQLGIVQVFMAERLVTEVSIDADFEESLQIIKNWQPLNTVNPSTRENITLGIQSRALAKLHKDHGSLEDGKKELRRYLSLYAVKNRPEEGWAAGDLAHILLELGEPGEAELVIRQYLNPRQASLTAEQRHGNRRTDTMYLEILLCEVFLSQSRAIECEENLQDLLTRFRSFGVLWYFEQFRLFVVQATLARLRQKHERYSEALVYWEDALDTCLSHLNVGYQEGNWGRQTFFPSIVLLSMAHCWYELGERGKADALRIESETVLQVTAPRPWVLALGTYWLAWVRDRIEVFR